MNLKMKYDLFPRVCEHTHARTHSLTTQTTITKGVTRSDFSGNFFVFFRLFFWHKSNKLTLFHVFLLIALVNKEINRKVLFRNAAKPFVIPSLRASDWVKRCETQKRQHGKGEDVIANLGNNDHHPRITIVIINHINQLNNDNSPRLNLMLIFHVQSTPHYQWSMVTSCSIKFYCAIAV